MKCKGNIKQVMVNEIIKRYPKEMCLKFNKATLRSTVIERLCGAHPFIDESLLLLCTSPINSDKILFILFSLNVNVLSLPLFLSLSLFSLS
jgi:hypothetical protein